MHRGLIDQTFTYEERVLLKELAAVVAGVNDFTDIDLSIVHSNFYKFLHEAYQGFAEHIEQHDENPVITSKGLTLLREEIPQMLIQAKSFLHLKNEYRAQIRRVLGNQNGTLQQFFNRLSEHVVAPTLFVAHVHVILVLYQYKVQSHFVELLIVHLLSILIFLSH